MFGVITSDRRCLQSFRLYNSTQFTSVTNAWTDGRKSASIYIQRFYEVCRAVKTDDCSHWQSLQRWHCGKHSINTFSWNTVFFDGGDGLYTPFRLNFGKNVKIRRWQRWIVSKLPVTKEWKFVTILYHIRVVTN